MVIETGGVSVFPRLVAGRASEADSSARRLAATVRPSTVSGRRLERGSSTLVLGPAGTGKSLLTLTFAVQARQRGEKAALFVFDEELGLLFERAKGLGIDLQALNDGGNLHGGANRRRRDEPG